MIRSNPGGLSQLAVIALLGSTLGACVTSRMENVRQEATGIAEGEGVVIMAKSYHLGNETQLHFLHRRLDRARLIRTSRYPEPRIC